MKSTAAQDFGSVDFFASSTGGPNAKNPFLGLMQNSPTTGRYLAVLRAAENEHGEALEQMFGLQNNE